MLILMHFCSMVWLRSLADEPVGQLPAVCQAFPWSSFENVILRGQLDQSSGFTPEPLRPPDHHCLEPTPNSAEQREKNKQMLFPLTAGDILTTQRIRKRTAVNLFVLGKWKPIIEFGKR